MILETPAKYLVKVVEKLLHHEMLGKVGIWVVQSIGNSHKKCFHCSLLYKENAIFCLNDLYS